jgi:hypothetical protein
MRSAAQQKLPVIGEIGHGKHVLFFVSCLEKEHATVSISPIEGRKVTYIAIDILKDKQALQKEFAATLQHYHYVSTLILDAVSLSIFALNIERLQNSLTYLKQVIVFNPVKAQISVLDKVKSKLNPSKYFTSNNKNIVLPAFVHKDQSSTNTKLTMLHSNQNYVIGFQDPTYSFTMATRIPNTIYEHIESYDELQPLLSKIIL